MMQSLRVGLFGFVRENFLHLTSLELHITLFAFAFVVEASNNVRLSHELLHLV